LPTLWPGREEIEGAAIPNEEEGDAVSEEIMVDVCGVDGDNDEKRVSGLEFVISRY
jgi:hypothetical protein